MTSINKL